jgi:DNA-binding NtrC family response regulator
MRMPGAGGIDTLRRIREGAAGMGVIVMTGYGTPDLAARSLRLGAAAYLAKPFDLADLLLAVGRWSEQRGRGRAPTDPAGVGTESADSEVGGALLGEAVALLLREAADRIEGRGAVGAAEMRRMLARLERASDRTRGTIGQGTTRPVNSPTNGPRSP